MMVGVVVNINQKVFYNDKLSMYSSFLVLELANIADF